MIKLRGESSTELFEGPDGHVYDVPVHRLPATRWPKKVDFQVGSYTNKVLIEYDGEALFPEIALVRIARSQDWQGAWLDTYHQDRRWSDMPEASEPIELPPRQKELLAAISERHQKRGGSWDVIVWKDDEVGFIESKSTDQILDNQRTWFRAALEAGLSPSAFCIAEWKVAGMQPRRGTRSEARPSATAGGSMPIKPELEVALPGTYQDKVKRLGLSLVSDNTLRRVRAGASAYPSRVTPLIGRNLIEAGGEALTDLGLKSLEMLDESLGADAYPSSLLK